MTRQSRSLVKGPAKSKPEFQCKACRKEFKSKTWFESHVKSCEYDPENYVPKRKYKNASKLFRCKLCKIQIKGEVRFNHHKAKGGCTISAYHKYNYKCEYCNKRFQTGPGFAAHKTDSECAIKAKNGIKAEKKVIDKASMIWDCERCDKKFVTRRLLRQHIKVHKKSYKGDVTELSNEPSYSFDDYQALYICNVCLRNFPNEKEAITHLKSHADYFKCNQCDLIFKDSLKWCLHWIEHKSGGKVNCPLCSYSTEKIESFKIHAETEHTSFTCKKCKITFAHKNELVLHRKNHEEPKFRLYVCVVCGKTGKSRAQVHLHQIRHHQVSSSGKPIGGPCRLCRRYFQNDRLLGQHQAKCKGKKDEIKKYLCKHCGKAFRRTSQLEKHERVHTGERPFTCSFCGKSFGREDMLRQHTWIHTGEKPYKCEFCAQYFRTRPTLQLHRRTHTGEKPYVCPFCQRGFTNSRARRLHKEKCTADQPGPAPYFNKTEAQEYGILLWDDTAEAI